MSGNGASTARWGLPLSILLGIFLVDIFTPLGFTDWLLDLLFFFAFFKRLDRQFFRVAASIASLSITLGLFLSPADIPFLYAVLSRSLGLIILWVIGSWLLRLKESQTALKEAQTAYRASEQRLSQIFNTVGVGMLEFDADDCLTMVNDQICRDFGYSRGELDGMSLNSLTAPEDRETTAAIRAQIRNGVLKGAEYDKCYIKRDGTNLWMHVTVKPVLDGEGQFLRAVATLEDISLRKAAEESLASTSRLLNALSETTPDPFYAKDLESRLIFLNPATARAIGKPAEYLLGKNEREWLDDLDQATVMIENDRRVMATGEALVFEEAMNSPQGVRILSSSKIPLRDSEGKIIGIVGTSRDVTMVKRAEEELRRAKDELEVRVLERTRELEEAHRRVRHETEERLAAMVELRAKERMLIQQSRLAAMGEMIANISHQWRQPLNILGLVIQEVDLSARSGTLTRSRIEENITRAMRIINEMSRTIDDFRNFFSPDKLPVIFTTREVVEKALSFMEAVFKQLQVQVDLSCEDETPVEGLRNEFIQVILNLLANARDAFRDREVEEPRLNIRLFRENGRLVVSVADNGGGIPEEIIDRIFEPYFTTKGPDRGTGIGLFMSKTIVEKHMGGRLSVANRGEGAEFRVEIPAGGEGSE